MLYIHQSTCVSPQETFPQANLEVLNLSTDNQLKSKEPSYTGIPENILRRMGKAVRMGVGAAMPLLQSEHKPHGIIIGTANGGMEDCIKFLNQIIDYDEGVLTPTNFVQSTSNAVAAQVGLLSANKAYNITHTHRGLSFETALIDAMMLAKEHPEKTYLVGAVDEISTYNYNIDFLAGWYKEELISNKDLYKSETQASIAGEGSMMFLVSGNSTNAKVTIEAVDCFQSDDMNLVETRMRIFLDTWFMGANEIDALITGENGDTRLEVLYSRAEDLMKEDTALLRFKHMSGEYPTASAFATWLAAELIQQQRIPTHLIKRAGNRSSLKTILIYNSYRGEQHSLIKVAVAENSI